MTIKELEVEFESRIRREPYRLRNELEWMSLSGEVSGGEGLRSMLRYSGVSGWGHEFRSAKNNDALSIELLSFGFTRMMPGSGRKMFTLRVVLSYDVGKREIVVLCHVYEFYDMWTCVWELKRICDVGFDDAVDVFFGEMKEFSECFKEGLRK